MVRSLASLRWLLLSLLVCACAADKTPRTELILVANTDIAGLDAIRFEVSGNGRTETAEANIREDGEPLTLGVVRSSESLGPVTVSAHGLQAGREIVKRSAVVSFVVDKTLVVVLDLLQSCQGVICKAAESCTQNGCDDATLDPNSLPEWNGTPPNLDDSSATSADAGDMDGGTTDGGTTDGGSTDGGSTDAGDGGRDAGNEFVDCGGNARNVDLMNDVEHCGMCKNTCKAGGRNTVGACMAGTCGVECRLLTGDCDDDLSNGCEETLVQDQHCGACNMQCASGTLCWLGVCR